MMNNTVDFTALKPLMRDFYSRSTIKVARELLGCYLVHHSLDGITGGMIVETEAYLQNNDPACHTSRGLTRRNQVMFGPPGYAYVYFVYGIYYCFNAVTNSMGIGDAVLIRALQPVAGIPQMQQRRGKERSRDLCSGPAKLVQALGILKEHNGADLTSGPVCIYPRLEKPPAVVTTTRIGIKAGSELLLRYYIEGNSYISKK